MLAAAEEKPGEWVTFTRQADGARVAAIKIPRTSPDGRSVGVYIEIEQSPGKEFAHVDGYAEHAGKNVGEQLNVMRRRFTSWDEASAFAERYLQAAVAFVDGPAPEWRDRSCRSYAEA